MKSPGTLPFVAMEGRYRAVPLDTWDELLAQVRIAPPSSVVLLNGEGEERQEVPQRVRELAAASPLVPVVVLVSFEPKNGEYMKALLSAGVSELADTPLEGTAGAIPARLQAVHAAPFRLRLEAQLSRFVPADGLTLVRAAANVAVDQSGAPELAAVFGVNERTVAGWCHGAGLPGPRRLLTWLRVLLALALLEDPRRTISGVARCTGYVADWSLRRAIAGLLGRERRAPTRARGFAEGMDAFNRELRDLRERRRERAAAKVGRSPGGS